MRDLKTLANDTPKDYLLHFPQDPVRLALQMEMKAQRLFPIPTGQIGQVVETNYSFLYIGPGSGLVVQALLDRGHRAFGLETSRRGIASASEMVRNSLVWAMPWELPFASGRLQGQPIEGQHTAPTPFKMFQVGILNKYYKEILTKDEWNESIKEIKKVCRYAAIV